ncbi:regulator of chromosome condensation 1/beta-lactamase-inhibitor protein II [Bisporella sp. PMI_857]|nr:regulator of chromosome condensation 1/beta-lactamase-inhibitor protein II [Bisporella sp. PMI_857]
MLTTMALGRNTNWEGPTKDVDDNASSDGSDRVDFNPLESTPTAINLDGLGRGPFTFLQGAAMDNASFVLTSTVKPRYIGMLLKGKRAGLREKLTQRKPAPIHQLRNITSLAAGGNRVLALDDQGRTYTWSVGQQGQLGPSIPNQCSCLYPCWLGLSQVKCIACGTNHGFAVTEGGDVYAWGLNNFGQTGIIQGAGEDGAIIHTPTIVKRLRPLRSSKFKESNTTLSGVQMTEQF